MSRFVKIGEAAKYLGVSIQTLRRWERDGILSSEQARPGQTRYYDINKLKGASNKQAELTIAYARVSRVDKLYFRSKNKKTGIDS